MTDDRTPDAVPIERTFDVPVDLVWQMWTVPEHFAAWYGPTGATIPVARMDVRVGGTRLVCMEVRTPDGPRQMWFAGEFLEVDDHQRLVYTGGSPTRTAPRRHRTCPPGIPRSPRSESSSPRWTGRPGWS